MLWTSWLLLLIGAIIGAILALSLTGVFIVLGLVYFEKKREVRRSLELEMKERNVALHASGHHQKMRGVQLVPEQRGRVKIQPGTQRGYVNYYDVPWSFAVLKSNMLFQFRDASSTACSACINLDGASVKVVHWIKSGGRVCSKYHRKSAIRISAPASQHLVPGEKSVFVYFYRGVEMEEWLIGLKKAVKASKMGPETVRQLDAENQYFMHLNTILSMGEPVQADWLNALLGRAFWSAHNNPFVRKLLKKGLQSKIDKLKKPTFRVVTVNSITVKDASLGPNMPILSNVVLNSLSPQGAFSMDMDVLYHGGFHLVLEIILSFTVPLTKRVIILPVISNVNIRCVAGRVNVRVGPPPGVKTWLGFYGLPRLDVDIRTDVGKKESNFVLRDLPAIARVVTVKIKEKLLKKFVLPTMEDFPFPAVPKSITKKALDELEQEDGKPTTAATTTTTTTTTTTVVQDEAPEPVRERYVASTTIVPTRRATSTTSTPSVPVSAVAEAAAGDRLPHAASSALNATSTKTAIKRPVSMQITSSDASRQVVHGSKGLPPIPSRNEFLLQQAASDMVTTNPVKAEVECEDIDQKQGIDMVADEKQSEIKVADEKHSEIKVADEKQSIDSEVMEADEKQSIDSEVMEADEKQIIDSEAKVADEKQSIEVKVADIEFDPNADTKIEFSSNIIDPFAPQNETVYVDPVMEGQEEEDNDEDEDETDRLSVDELLELTRSRGKNGLANAISQIAPPKDKRHASASRREAREKKKREKERRRTGSSLTNSNG